MLNDTELQSSRQIEWHDSNSVKNRGQFLFEQNAELLGVDWVSLENDEVIGLGWALLYFRSSLDC